MSTYVYERISSQIANEFESGARLRLKQRRQGDEIDVAHHAAAERQPSQRRRQPTQCRH